MTSYTTIKKLSIICLIGGLIAWVLYPFIYPIVICWSACDNSCTIASIFRATYWQT